MGGTVWIPLLTALTLAQSDGDPPREPMSQAELELLESLLDPVPWEAPEPLRWHLGDRLFDPLGPTVDRALEQLPVDTLVPILRPEWRTERLGGLWVDPRVGGWGRLHPDHLTDLALARRAPLARSPADREHLDLIVALPEEDGAFGRAAVASRFADRAGVGMVQAGGRTGLLSAYGSVRAEATDDVRVRIGGSEDSERVPDLNDRVQLVGATAVGTDQAFVRLVGAFDGPGSDPDAPAPEPERSLVGVLAAAPLGPLQIQAGVSRQTAAAEDTWVRWVGQSRIDWRISDAVQSRSTLVADPDRIEAGSGLAWNRRGWRVEGGLGYVRHGGSQTRQTVAADLRVDVPLAPGWTWSTWGRRGLEGLEDEPGPRPLPSRPDRIVHRLSSGPQVQGPWGHWRLEGTVLWTDPFASSDQTSGWVRSEFAWRPATVFTVAAAAAGFDLAEGLARDQGVAGHLSTRVDANRFFLESHVRAGYGGLSAPDGFVDLGFNAGVPLGAGFRLALAISNALDQPLTNPALDTRSPGVDLRVRLDFRAPPS